jgi:hypothetical protein
VFPVLFVLVLCLVCPMLPRSLDCSFLITPSVFDNIYFCLCPCIDNNSGNTLYARRAIHCSCGPLVLQWKTTFSYSEHLQENHIFSVYK